MLCRADKNVRLAISNTKDPRGIAWNESDALLKGFSATDILITLGFIYLPAWIPAVPSAIATIKSFSHWVSPSKKEKDISFFFKAS